MGERRIFVSETWGDRGRTPERQREIEDHKITRSRTKKRREERRIASEKRNNFGFSDIPEVREKCDICGYEQDDVVVFENLDMKTRMGPVRTKICPGCQPNELKNRRLKVIGLASEVLKPIPDSAVEARVVMF